MPHPGGSRPRDPDVVAQNVRRASSSQYFAVATVLTGGIASTGYLYGVPPVHDSAAYGPIEASTAALSVILSLALLCTHPTEGFMRTLMSPHIGGTLLRRLLPFAIGLPILAGWLRILGQRQGWYSLDFGVAVVVGIVLLILLICLWYVAAGPTESTESGAACQRN